MESLATTWLAAVVYLALPLPLFASAAIGVCPAVRSSIMPWVWANTIIGAVMGVMLIATHLSPFIPLAGGAISFVACGTQMIRRLTMLVSSGEQ